MKLVKFQVSNFRSVNDSGEVEVVDRTVLVGRNESGKSSLLKVLAGLKPAGGQLSAFTLARDYPRDRPRRSFSDDSEVLKTWWELDDDDRSALGQLWHRAANVTGFECGRPYKASRYVGFEGLSAVSENVAKTRSAVGNLVATAKEPQALVEALEALKVAADAKLTGATTTTAWGTAVLSCVTRARAAVDPKGSDATALNAGLTEIEQGATLVQKDEEQGASARNWVVTNMPTFVYLDEWDEVPGHHEVPAFLERKARGALTAEDRLFEKLLKVAELDAKELNDLLAQNHEERKLLTTRAARVLTKTLRGLWKDRKISVDFSLDAKHFDVLVSDSETEALVPLDERSRGFRWYFSFFVTFAADTQGGDKENALLLLDEPGLFLHATAQRALLAFLETLPNQIILTTHSPFMIDPARIDAVRTVNLVEATGTTVSGVPTGDANTLFPLQAALGYDLTQTLFVGTKTVLVEGVTDYWYLSAASEFLRDSGKEGIADGIVITPAGGAGKIPYMLALLTAQNLSVAVLFDAEPQAEATAKDVQRQKLIRPEGIIRVSDAFASAPRGGADVEDLLGTALFQDLTEKAYAKELAGKKPAWNAAVPRVALRAADALKAVGLEFHKTRPARLFLTEMAKDPAKLMAADVQERFERLFKAINATVVKLSGSKRGPFE